MRLLYASLVRPYLDYASNIWNPHLLEDTCTIEKIQRRATKLIPSFKQYSYHERLSSLNLPSLQYRWLRMDLIMTYKILHGTVHLSKDHFFLWTLTPQELMEWKFIRIIVIKVLEDIVFHRELSIIGINYPQKLLILQNYYYSKLN